jgi:hypothetical protein
MNIKPFQSNIDKTAKCNSKPQPRKSTAINHNLNTFLRNKKTEQAQNGHNNQARAPTAQIAKGTEPNHVQPSFLLPLSLSQS